MYSEEGNSLKHLHDKIAIVVTSISRPTKALVELGRKCGERGDHFIVIGDEASPRDFRVEGCEFYDIERQMASPYRYAQQCPTRHYARKNIGYLLAMERAAARIVETDDDNIPLETYWQPRQRRRLVKAVQDKRWVNVYHYFTEEHIWPRGFPLDAVRVKPMPWQELKTEELDCPVQQGLADNHPDVDAIYNLTMPLPQFFKKDRQVSLKPGAWCPFNSQNTTWWPPVYPLLYLPACCSFRLTDIWRSFVAQRIMWANGWNVLFHGPTVWQDRNAHDLMRDFRDEIAGYLNNYAIGDAFDKLPVKAGVEHLGDNLCLCYEKLISMRLVDKKELILLKAWLEDLKLASRSLPAMEYSASLAS